MHAAEPDLFSFLKSVLPEQELLAVLEPTASGVVITRDVIDGVVITGDRSSVIMGGDIAAEKNDDYFTTDLDHTHYWSGRRRATHADMPLSASVQIELHDLICTNSKKYAGLRRQIRQAYTRESQLALVGTISAGVAASLGVAVGIATPFVSIALLLVIKMAKELYCARCKQETIDLI
jgi:hypothetical protein